MRAARAATGFLTVLGGSAPPDRRAVAWFAPVGAALGLAVGGIWWGAHELWPPLVAAGLAVAADAILTGMLHLDGLVDTADGVLPPLDRARRLEVMRDPHPGAFGMVVTVLVLTLRISALATMTPDPLLVAGLWGIGRAAMAVVLTTVPYARGDGGLAGAFLDASPWPALAGGVVAGALVLVASDSVVAGLATLAATLLGAAAVTVLAARRLGGFTGDTLGATGVVAETCGLVVAAARW
jgi:adenosylcobinamide-GDP ribazoletransferase